MKIIMTKKKNNLKVSSAAVVIGCLTLRMLGNFACCFVVCRFSFKLTVSKKNHEYHQVSNSLEPDLSRRFIGSDLGPNCLQKLSADDKSRHYRGND